MHFLQACLVTQPTLPEHIARSYCKIFRNCYKAFLKFIFVTYHVIVGFRVTLQSLLLAQKLSEVAEQNKNSGSFMVSGKLLPSYITLSSAEKILFVGESVRMFSLQADTDNSARDVGQCTYTQPLSRLFSRFCGLAGDP